MIFNVDKLSPKARYKLTIGAILPRPIAWVSTMDEAGNLNAAPFSYFTAVCSDPMTLLFCTGFSPAKGGPKDTRRNIEAVGEFVINLVSEEVAEAMNQTAVVLPHGHSEFEFAGITPQASETIQVPRIAEAPIAYECKLQQIVVVSDRPGGGSTIFGEVQCIHVRDDIYQDGAIMLEKFKPVGRLGGLGYARITDTFEMIRPAPPQ